MRGLCTSSRAGQSRAGAAAAAACWVERGDAGRGRGARRGDGRGRAGELRSAGAEEAVDYQGGLHAASTQLATARCDAMRGASGGRVAGSGVGQRGQDRTGQDGTGQGEGRAGSGGGRDGRWFIGQAGDGSRGRRAAAGAAAAAAAADAATAAAAAAPAHAHGVARIALRRAVSGGGATGAGPGRRSPGATRRAGARFGSPVARGQGCLAGGGRGPYHVASSAWAGGGRPGASERARVRLAVQSLLLHATRRDETVLVLVGGVGGVLVVAHSALPSRSRRRRRRWWWRTASSSSSSCCCCCCWGRATGDGGSRDATEGGRQGTEAEAKLTILCAAPGAGSSLYLRALSGASDCDIVILAGCGVSRNRLGPGRGEGAVGMQ